MKIISIIIPVFNEFHTIDTLLQYVKDARLPGWRKDVIVVDDGSTDGTKKKLASWEKQFTIAYQMNNQGKGAAVVEGFKRIKGDIVLIQDADLEYNPKDYQLLLAPFDSPTVCVVYGSRFLGPHLSTMYLYAVGNKFVTFLTNILYNTNITDMETGYKVFRKEVIQNIHISAKRFDFEPEITAKTLKAGYQIYEVPISYLGRKHSEGKKLTWKDGLKAVWTLLKYRFIN